MIHSQHGARALDMQAMKILLQEQHADAVSEARYGATPSGDEKTLVALVSAENLRHPDAHIRVATNLPQFAERVGEMADRSRQGPGTAATFVVMANLEPGETSEIGEDGTDETHACAMHVVCKDGQASILGFDGVAQKTPQIGYLQLHCTELLRQRHTPTQMSVIGLRTQNSYSDCRQFALHMARQINAHPEVLTAMHERLASLYEAPVLDRKSDGAPAGRDDHQHVARWLETNGAVAQALTPLVPAPFFKHIQSRQALAGILREQPHLADRIVNRKGETIATRMARFQPPPSRTCAPYNKSIETKRLLRLERALALPAEALGPQIARTVNEANGAPV